MPQIGPEDRFERFHDIDISQKTLADETVVVQHHLENTGRTILYGPVDRLTPESQAMQELVLIQTVDLTFEDEVEKSLSLPTVGGVVFAPDRVEVIRDRGLYSNIKTSGELVVQFPGDVGMTLVEVEQVYLFAGAIERFKQQIFHKQEPKTRVRTRIYQA